MSLRKTLLLNYKTTLVHERIFHIMCLCVQFISAIQFYSLFLCNISIRWSIVQQVPEPAFLLYLILSLGSSTEIFLGHDFGFQWSYESIHCFICSFAPLKIMSTRLRPVGMIDFSLNQLSKDSPPLTGHVQTSKKFEWNPRC